MRQARSEAGLSLAGVARTDLSRTAIFLIETGKSNPTLPTLELIAERTGKPIDFFLDDELPAAGAGIDFIEIEQLLASEDFERVKELTSHHLLVRLPAPTPLGCASSRARRTSARPTPRVRRHCSPERASTTSR